MIPFPDESKLKLSEISNEPIRGGTIGINRVLALFPNASMRDQYPSWSFYLLNGYTIVRNVLDKIIPMNELLQAFTNDCDIFSIYLDAYISRFYPAQKVPLVVYLPTYDKIPKDMLREKKGHDKEVDDIYLEFLKRYPSHEVRISESQHSVRYILPVGKRDLPEIELSKWIHNYSEHNRESSYHWGNPIFLMTHCPIDLHIHRRVKNIFLIESHTANILDPSQFGRKLIKEIPIPFNFATHRAFGDRVHLVPIAQRKMKSDLIKKAEERKWMTRTTEMIVSDIMAVTGASYADLTRLRF